MAPWLPSTAGIPAKPDHRSWPEARRYPGRFEDRELANSIPRRLPTRQNISWRRSRQRQNASPCRMSFHSPVKDSTGIQGSWDFTLSFSSADVTRLAQPVAGSSQLTAPPPTQMAPSPCPDAVSRQLGLKFETHKRPVPVLVIDHIDETPTEN